MAKRLPSWVTVDYLRELKRTAEEHPSRRQYRKNLAGCYGFYSADFYTGDQLLAAMRSMGDDMEIDAGEPVARRNIIKREIDKVISIFMKNTPVVRRHPFFPQDAKLSDDLDALYLQAWLSSSAQNVVRSMLLEAAICGLSIGKVYWDPYNRTYDKHGAIAIKKLAPGAVLMDPWASNDHRGTDVGFIFHTSQQPISTIAKRYGRKAEEALNLKDGGREKVGTRVIRGIKSAVSSSRIADDSGAIPRKGYEKVVEVWLFPQSDQSSPLTTGERLPDDDYPYGLVVTLVKDKIVRHMPNPFVKKTRGTRFNSDGEEVRRDVEIGHKRHPFSCLYWSRTASKRGTGTNEFYDCSGAVEGMINKQVNMDRLRRNISQNAQTFANPSAVVQEDALATPLTSLKWLTSQILRVQPPYTAQDAVQLLQGSQMPQYVMDMVMDDDANMGRDAGIEPGVVGLFPQGGGTSHTPARTIESLGEAAFGPLWSRVQELGDTLLDMATLYDGLIQQYYRAGRYMSVSRHGENRLLEWTSRHISANFTRQVIAGATTPMFDLERQQRVAGVVEIVNQAIISQNPRIMEVAIAHLEALRFPWAHDFKQILEQVYQETLSVQAGGQQLEEMALNIEGAGLMQGAAGQQEAQPGGTDEDDMLTVINELANMEGVSPEQVAMKMAETGGI